MWHAKTSNFARSRWLPVTSGRSVMEWPDWVARWSAPGAIMSDSARDGGPLEVAMDESFRSEMAAGYTLTEPTIVLGSPMLGDEVLSEVRVQIALSRVNRHGLIAGRDRHRQDQDAAAVRGPALRARRAGVRGRREGRPVGDRRARRRHGPADHRPLHLPRVDVPGRRPPGRDPVPVRQDRRARPRQRLVVRAAAAGQGPRPQRHADLDPVAGLPLLRRPGAAAARPRGPADDAEVPGLRRRASPSSRTWAASALPRWA